MEIISYEYTKPRRQFGLHPAFADSSPISESISNTESAVQAAAAQWIESLTTTLELDCIPEQSVHSINTERYETVSRGTLHTEGAWPAELKTSEFADRQRFVRRITNEPSYSSAIVELTKKSESIIGQNNTIDLYEQYYSSVSEDYQSQPPSAKTVCVFRDPNRIKRSATKISWHPDGASKVAISYSIQYFQGQPADMSAASYIWDVTAPNAPDQKLLPSSPLTCITYNPRSPDHIVGGSYNGQINFWDLRKGSNPVDYSLLELSHSDPVYDIYWIQSRTGNECCSVSTDGQLLWWDIRKLKKGYTDSMQLTVNNNNQSVNIDPNSAEAQLQSILYGGTAMDYKSDAGATRFLVGTDSGCALLADRKAKKDSDSQKSIKATYGLMNTNIGANSSTAAGAHFGPIYSIQRNPFNLKYFLTVGDWTAKIWMEDLKSPLISTRTDNSYLTSGCWSPSRPGVFFTSKYDGCIDIWDLYHKQSDPILTQKISDSPLTAMKINSTGKQIAIGDSTGTTTIVQLSRGLAEVQKDEKTIIAALFERETRREKHLELRYLQRKRDAKEREKQLAVAAQAAVIAQQQQSQSNQQLEEKSANNNISDDDSTSADIRELLKHAEEEFYTIIDLNGQGNNNNNNNGSSSSTVSNGTIDHSISALSREDEEEKEFEEED